MAIIHRATVTPSKLELLQNYLPHIDALARFVGTDLAALGAYRFDDPAGVVGLETHLLAGADSAVLHIPVTYRSAPLDDAQQWCIGTAEHSILGPRWVYFGAGDPVYRAVLVDTIVTAGTQVREMVQTDEGEVERDPTARVQGSGVTGSTFDLTNAAVTFEATNVILETETTKATVPLVINPEQDLPDTPNLQGTWKTQATPTLLATLESR